MLNRDSPVIDDAEYCHFRRRGMVNLCGTEIGGVEMPKFFKAGVALVNRRLERPNNAVNSDTRCRLVGTILQSREL